MNVNPDLLKQVLASLDDGITIQDREFRIIYQNHLLASRFGDVAPDARGSKCHEVYERRSEVCEGCGVLQSFATGQKVVVRREVIEPGGRRAWWENTCIPLRDADGAIVAGAEICRDITDRVVLEDEIVESDRALSKLNQEYRTLLAHLPVYVVRYDRDLRRVYVNPAWERATGLRADEVVGVAPQAIPRVPRPVNEDYLEMLRGVLADGRPRTCVFAWENAAGERLHLDYQIVPEFDGTGQVATVLAVGHDLTARVAAEEALREQQRHAESLLRLSRKLESADSYAGIIGAAREEVHATLGYTNLWAYMFSDDGRHADVLVADGAQSTTITATTEFARLTIAGDAMLEEITRTRDIVVVEDAQSDPRTNKDIVTRLGNRTIVNVPIVLFDRHLGSIGTGTFGDEGARPPNSSERAYLTALASHVATTLDRVRLMGEQRLAAESLRRVNRQLRAVSICNQILIRVDDEQVLLHEVCRVIRDEAGYRVAWVGLVGTDATRDFRAAAWAGGGGDDIDGDGLNGLGDEMGRGRIGEAIRAGHTVVFQDIAADDRLATWRERARVPGLGAGLALPLKDVAGAVIGVLLVFGGEPGAITTDETALMEELAGDLAFGVTTLRDRAEQEEAKRQIQLLSTAMNSVHEGAFLISDDGRILYVNDEACRSLEYTREELLGLRVSDIDPGFPAEAFPEAAARLQEWGAVTFTTSHRTKSGRTFPVEIHSSNLVFEGAGFGLSLARDISERRRLEDGLRQAQKMESIGLLAGGVAHDFNNMLAIILGSAEMAADNVEPEHPARPWLESIIKASGNAAELTRQLLTFARKQSVVPKVFDMNQAVAGMLKMLQRLIGESIHLDWSPFDQALPIHLDPVQLNQVLVNLCVNARDAITENGRIVITTRLEPAAVGMPGRVGGPCAVLEVADNGQGMDAETRARVFEPFFTTKETGRGTGLGLATVYGIATQNGGFVQVDSEPGRGTSFRVSLPLALRAPAEPGPDAEATGVPGGHETILLIEDEPSILELTARLLEGCGYRVLVAGNAVEAFRQAEAHRESIDLLVTDVVMPGLNGCEIAATLARRLPGLRCLYVSGHPADVIARHGLRAESINLLAKPFSRDALARAVRTALDGAVIDPVPPFPYAHDDGGA